MYFFNQFISETSFILSIGVIDDKLNIKIIMKKVGYEVL
jgi:hypothetical protein